MHLIMYKVARHDSSEHAKQRMRTPQVTTQYCTKMQNMFQAPGTTAQAVMMTYNPPAAQCAGNPLCQRLDALLRRTCTVS